MISSYNEAMATKKLTTNISDDAPPQQSLAKNLFDITQIIGTKPDFKLLTKPVAGKRAFKDAKGVFYEMTEGDKDKQTVAE